MLALILADIRRHLPGLLIVYVLIGAAVFATFLVARSAGVDFFVLTKDPFAGQVESTPVYTSILSNFGIVLWCVAMSAQFFAAWLLSDRGVDTGEAAYLFWSGIVTAMLMLDDFLMLHERLDHTAEAVAFGAYGVIVAAVFLRYLRVVLRTNYLVLGAALFFFLLSMVLDNVVERVGVDIPYRTLLEDAFKLIGILGWAVYFTTVSGRFARDVGT